MHSHTPAPPRMRSARERESRVVIATTGEDYPDEAPTVMAADLQELGIDPDSLSIDAGAARRILRDPHRNGARPRHLDRSASPLVKPAPRPPRAQSPTRSNTTKADADRRKRDQVHMLTIIALAALPVLLALIAALWLTVG